MERSCCHNESIRFTHSVHTRTRTHRHTKTVIDWNTKETHTSMEHSSSLHEYVWKRIKRSFEQEKSMFKPYLSLDVLKSQRSHVPHLWGTTNMGCKPKCGYHSLSSIACSRSFSFPFFPIKFLSCACFLLFYSVLYCKFGVGSFIAVDAYLHYISIASFGKLKHTKYSYIV